MPHRGGVFLNNTEAVTEYQSSHLLGRVVGKSGVQLPHDLMLVGIVNHGVTARLQDLFDVT